MGARQSVRIVAACIWLAAAACGGAAAGEPASAESPPAEAITPGSGKVLKAAVQRFSDASEDPDADRARRFQRALSDALAYANDFDAIDPEKFVGPEETRDFSSRTKLACKDWTAIEADALVEGELQVDAEHTSAEFRLWDTRRCERLLRKRYHQEAALDPRNLARRIADDVVAAFVGVPGVASTELAFVSDRNGTKEIYLMDPDGRGQRALTANGAINNFPDWSPDGDSIVFSSYRSRNRPVLFVVTRGEKGPQRLLGGLEPDRSQYRGVFDPMGKRLAVVMSDGGPSEIYVVEPADRKIRQLTSNQWIDISPTWSPGGDRIAFVSDRSGAPQIYVMDADGGNLRRLTRNGAYNTAPAWSPDGSWIAYETKVAGQFDIWVIDPEGEVNLPLVTHRANDEGPTWAPNSRKLSFSSTRRGSADIYVIDVGTRKVTRLTKDAGNNTSPAWGPFPR